MPFPHLSRKAILFLRQAVVDFYAHRARPLPWRRQRSVYHTLVSEMMLQQTQVKTVVPYFERWIRRFPDLESLAQADKAEVLGLWEGLGYYRRTSALHEIARIIRRQGQLPQTVDDWEKLPGIGRYTAAAIASFSQNIPVAVVDGNILRVLLRFGNVRRPFASRAQSLSHLRPLAERCLDPQQHALYNEGLMELGALVCLPQRPQCRLCPLAPHCRAHRQATAESIPRFKIPSYRKVHKARGLFFHQDRLLLSPMGASTQPTALIWEFPEIPLPSSSRPPLFTGRRSIGLSRFTEHFHILEIDENIPMPSGGRWFSAAELKRIPLSGPHRRWLPKLWEIVQGKRDSSEKRDSSAVALPLQSGP
ncbi:MAG: A/G-specific adenine glycosylase [Puniceicoccales bacterium]|jgi:A/G-specific adenine glycosylase|nr:A/G-specific adenine glycosylase [Puniceicoccales bacterium]